MDPRAMRMICTGTSGTDRVDYLREVARLASASGYPLEIFDVRDAMFQIAHDVSQEVEEETILDMFPRALMMLRAAALEKIASLCEGVERHPNWIINTHAVFRWKNTLISGFDPYYIRRLRPDLYVTITSGVQTLRNQLRGHARWEQLSIEDLLVWREEEQFATEEMARVQRKPQYLLGRSAPAETLYRLLFEPQRRKVYLSYPIAHVESGADRGLASFKQRLADNMIVFDPGDVNDFAVERQPAGGNGSLKLGDADADGPSEATGLGKRERGHIADQIVWRDYKLISQSDMVVVFYDAAVPSPGVVSEMNYALHGGKRVYGVWLPKAEPSPFFTRYCTRVFRSQDDLFQHFTRYRVVKPSQNATGPLHAEPSRLSS